MGEKAQRINLLDCTLRDGSYAINFQFTARDTRNICAALDRAGLRRIEIGHGMGIGASSPRYGVAFENDLDYVEAACSAVDKAKIGIFFIPGVGTLESLREVAHCGLGFVRIGINATEVGGAQEVVETALAVGLEVHLNVMKSYALPVGLLKERLCHYQGLGLTSVYVVDSAGCMLPNMVGEYVRAMVNGDWSVGFHGHNNLDLANANCLAALEAGAEFVDSTLCGMGRSGGNAQTEVLGWLLSQMGYDAEVDTFELFEVAENYLRPLMIRSQGKAVLEVVTGMSRFHSGFLPRFKRVIGRYDVNLYRLIQKVSEVDCVDPSEDLIASIARDMSRTDE